MIKTQSKKQAKGKKQTTINLTPAIKNELERRRKKSPITVTMTYIINKTLRDGLELTDVFGEPRQDFLKSQR